MKEISTSAMCVHFDIKQSRMVLSVGTDYSDDAFCAACEAHSRGKLAGLYVEFPPSLILESLIESHMTGLQDAGLVLDAHAKPMVALLRLELVEMLKRIDQISFKEVRS